MSNPGKLAGSGYKARKKTMKRIRFMTRISSPFLMIISLCLFTFVCFSLLIIKRDITDRTVTVTKVDIPLKFEGRISIIVPIIARDAMLMGYDSATYSMRERLGLNFKMLRRKKPRAKISTITYKIAFIVPM